MYYSNLALFDERYKVFSTSGPGTLVDKILIVCRSYLFFSADAELEKITDVLKNTVCLFFLLTSTIVIPDCSQASLTLEGTL